VYGVFATVLGLMAWLYLAAEITVYCAEINVVLARRLYPRAIVQPPLTEADRTSMALQALQNQRRKEQQVTVTFNDRTADDPVPPRAPQTPDEVSPPASRRRRGRRKRVPAQPVPEPRPAAEPADEQDQSAGHRDSPAGDQDQPAELPGTLIGHEDQLTGLPEAAGEHQDSVS